MGRKALLAACLGTVAYLAIGFLAPAGEWDRLLPGVYAWTLVKLATTKLFVELVLLAATVAFQRNGSAGQQSIPTPAAEGHKVASGAASLGAGAP
jgi:hypothetical protein